MRPARMRPLAADHIDLEKYAADLAYSPHTHPSAPQTPTTNPFSGVGGSGGGGGGGSAFSFGTGVGMGGIGGGGGSFGGGSVLGSAINGGGGTPKKLRPGRRRPSISSGWITGLGRLPQAINSRRILYLALVCFLVSFSFFFARLLLARPPVSVVKGDITSENFCSINSYDKHIISAQFTRSFDFTVNNPDYTNFPISSIRPHFEYDPARLAAENSRLPPVVSVVVQFDNCDHSCVPSNDTVQSIMKQSLSLWELIFLTSSRATRKFTAQLKHPRVRVVSPDQEANAAPPSDEEEDEEEDEEDDELDGLRRKKIDSGVVLDVAFQSATTDLVFLLKNGDMLEPSALEEFYWALFSHPEYAFVNSYSVVLGAENSLWNKGFHSGVDLLRHNPILGNVMIRKSIWFEVGGYDSDIPESIREWDFWLKCAEKGKWGATLPEYLDWTRTMIKREEKSSELITKTLQERHPTISDRPGDPGKVFPELMQHHPHTHSFRLESDIPIANTLPKVNPRILLISSGRAAGDELSMLFMQLSMLQWEATVVTTTTGQDDDAAFVVDLAHSTSDIFILPNILSAADYPRFLAYLVQSRQPDVVMVTNNEAGYHLLPFLRSRRPEPAYMDYHFAQEHWRDEGHHGPVALGMLDMHVVYSTPVKDWMVALGAHTSSIYVLHNPEFDRTSSLTAMGERMVELICTAIENRKRVVLSETTIRRNLESEIASKAVEFILVRRAKEVQEQRLRARMEALSDQVTQLQQLEDQRVKDREMHDAQDLKLKQQNSEALNQLEDTQRKSKDLLEQVNELKMKHEAVQRENQELAAYKLSVVPIIEQLREVLSNGAP